MGALRAGGAPEGVDSTVGGLHGDPGPGGRRRRVQPPPPGPLGRRCRGGRGVSQASGLLRPFLPSPLRERAGLGALGERGRGPGPRGPGFCALGGVPGPGSQPAEGGGVMAESRGSGARAAGVGCGGSGAPE